MKTFLLFEKLERSLRLQQHCLDVIEYDQARTALSALQRSRVKHLLLLIFSNIVIGYFIAKHFTDLPLLISSGLLMLFNVIGIAGNITQMIIIQQQDCWENISSSYKKTGLLQTAALLQSVMIRFTRIRFLAWPLYSVYVLIAFWFIGWKVDWPLQAGMVVLIFPVSIYLYNKVRYTNLHIKWVEGLLNWAGRKYLLDLMGLRPAA